jgi:hypothetical protein
MLSETIKNTVWTIDERYRAGTLTEDAFYACLRALRAAADGVAEIEAHEVAPAARLTIHDLADGKIVLFPRAGRAGWRGVDTPGPAA